MGVPIKIVYSVHFAIDPDAISQLFIPLSGSLSLRDVCLNFSHISISALPYHLPAFYSLHSPMTRSANPDLK